MGYDTYFANKRPSWVKNLIILSYKWGQGAALLSFKQKFYVNMGQICQIKGRVGIRCQYGANLSNKRPSWVKNLIILSYKRGKGAALLSFKQKFYVNMTQILQIKGRVGLKT